MSSHECPQVGKPINGPGPSSNSQTSVNITQHSSSRGSPTPIDDASKIGETGRRVVRRRNESGQRGPGRISPRMTIGALPDNVLLDIFDFFREAEIETLAPWPWPWNRLVHVCQRWRYLVFASPLRLDLCLRYTSKTPVRETLDVWPPLPIEIQLPHPNDVDNIIASLEHRNRVRKIWILYVTSPLLERLAPIMQEPFPALTSLQLWTGETAPVLLDMFLGGSAPRLQTLALGGIPFSGLPRLLLSASDLFDICLERIPHIGYISPVAMVEGLSALTRLRRLVIEFESPASRPDRRGRRTPPLTRVILPALFKLQFRGVSEYLDDLVARIDAPRLRSLCISFFDQDIFDIQQLPDFIGHAGILRSSSHAEVIFAPNHVKINLYLPKGTDPPKKFNLGISCRALDWQLRSMAQICNQLSFLPSIVEQLDIQVTLFDRRRVHIEDTQWLELFRPFTAVRTLRIGRELRSLIVPALQGLTGERATEVLPTLDSLYLGGYQPSEYYHQEAIKSFIAARQYSAHPVAVHPW
ncbi:hypothetical protein BJV78DRAFT_422046 [Lactifluus subvellereus]|nr:hypothetical protein BJV78DRAFT_422046 [Lactifluus subvellereus]